MTKITVATFNCENLFIRYRFGSKVKEATIKKAVENGFIKDKKLFQFVFENERRLTASAIKETNADIICLQEVENLDTLKSFQSRNVKKYKYQYLIDGNDPRFIDVAVMSKEKFPAKYIKTHQWDFSGKSKIFSRDCLEIEFDINGTPLTIFANHFKSMMGGRGPTTARRKAQSERVVEIIKDKFGNNPAKEHFIVLGDLNDYVPGAGLQPLVGQPWLENVIATRLPAGQSWTHWWDKEKSVTQLDYILISKKLSIKNPTVKPVIIRKGISTKCSQYTGSRYPDVSANIEASDHCPVAITLNI